MEDRSREAEMAEWVKSSSEAGMAQIARLPGRARLRDALETASRAGVSYREVHAAGGRLFSLRLDADASVAKLVVREADGAERVLFDPASESRTAPVAIDTFMPSPSGQLVAVHTTAGGGEVGPIRFLDVRTGRWRDDRIEPVWGEFYAAWMGDAAVFFTRLRVAAGPDLFKDLGGGVHTLGTPSSEDTIVLASSGPQRVTVRPDELPVLSTSPHSDWSLGLLAGARVDTRMLVARTADLTAGRPAWREVAGYDDQIVSSGLLGSSIYAISTKRAPNGEVHRIDAATGTARDTVVVMPASDVVLTALFAATDGIYVVTLKDGINGLLFLPGGKSPALTVTLEPATISGVAATGDGRGITFGVTTWTRNVRFVLAEGGTARETGIASASYTGAGNVDAMVTEAVSADGTRVPLTILSLKQAAKTGAAPALLNAYGSYGISMSPSYSANLFPWIERGGVYAVCSVRGGGEKGRAWHEAGRAANKKNAHADFIACAETLIASNHTRADHLAVTGTSAGGHLVPPVALERPDLFRAVVSRVGVVNPTRYAAAESGPNQYAEFGDPGTEVGFRGLALQDAYLMLDQAADSPDWFITVGLNDHRVEPWMSAKFAAKALQKFGDKRLVLIRADAEAGHGVGSTRDQTVEEWADTFSFLLNRFGDPEFQIPPSQ
jgi:prolyl oligopeptidase